MNPLLDLLADGPVAALHFHTAGGTSRSVRAFITELCAILSNGTKKPLICTTDHELTAIFRLFGHARIQDARGLDAAMTGGKRFADISGYDSNVYLDTCAAGDNNVTGIVLPEGGRWDGGRTPENTARHALPVFESDTVSRAVLGLLDRLIESGKLIDTAATAAPPRQDWTAPVYADEISIANPPGDLDPTDARRRDPEYIRKLRALRHKVFGRDSGAVIEGPAGRVSRKEFDAA